MTLLQRRNAGHHKMLEETTTKTTTTITTKISHIKSATCRRIGKSQRYTRQHLHVMSVFQSRFVNSLVVITTFWNFAALATPLTPTTTVATHPADNAAIIGATSLVAAAAAAAADMPMPRGNAEARDGKKQIYSKSNGHRVMIADSANLLLENLQHPTGHIVNLTRHYDGDVFRTNGVASCNMDTCVGFSSGTAGINQLGGLRSELHAHTPANTDSRLVKATVVGSNIMAKNMDENSGDESCQCRCLPYLSTYREDLGICVDDIHECTLSPFVSGSTSEKIPFVFLPLRGQIIYPSREISFADIRTPVCAVTGAQFLTVNGWSDLRNPIDSDYPFRMFRDEGRTFLQWLGEVDLRQKMQGRLIVVHLVCRDMMIAMNGTLKEHLMAPKNVFSPCVAFRVSGSPVKYSPNVSEVLFQSETTATLSSSSDGMSTKEYVVIGACSLLLGLIYVSSVFLYLHVKKRKTRDQRHTRNSLDDLTNEINYPKNDQVTFGAPFNRSGSLYSATSLGTSNEPRSRASIGSLKEEMGIVKNNPLLQHFPQLSDHHSGFASDISNSNSECETDGASGLGSGNIFHDKLKQLQTAVLVHPQSGKNSSTGSPPHGSVGCGSNDGNEHSTSPTQEPECIPQENVAIVEDMMTEEKLENLRAMVNGNVRKKLYFNPAYFEPHLLVDPPPAAVEFLQKIREVIAIAKYKMATKRYQPSLIMIPEENSLNSSKANSHYSAQLPTSTECHACLNNRCSGHVKNCGDKRNSIEKWLETVSSTEREKGMSSKKSSGLLSTPTENTQKQYKHATSPPENNESRQPTNVAGKQNMNNRNSPPRKDISPPKQRPPPPPQQAVSSESSDKLPSALSPNKSVIEITQSNQIYQHYTATSVKVPINCSNNYESFSSLTAAANIYGFAETGSEIYNNPKFMLHDSPAASQRSRSSSHRSKNSRKRLEVLDQYAAASTPTSLTSAERQHYEHLRNMKQMPETIYEVTKRADYNASLSTNGSFHLDIPTPDYDSTMEKKIKDIYNNTQSSGPSVPTPDYSTLSRKSLKQYQPDSPIYRRKSPQYLIVDYETDSLERLETTKRKSSHSSSSPSSDVSSQMSPSLSTALPLEEELEISHTVYNKMDGFRKEENLKQKLLNNSAALAAEKQKEIATRIKYDTPFRGSMTIEVEHEPQSDLERSTDSDQFEPDTLDRKPKKQSFCDALSEQIKRNAQLALQEQDEYLQATNMSSLPDMSRPSSGFRLNPSSSFRSQHERSPTYETHVELRMKHYREGFGSLNDLPQSIYMRDSCKCGVNAARDYETLSEQGRLLTLEAKHSRRQRLLEPSSITPPPVVEITKVSATKTTIKISTPKVNRSAIQSAKPSAETMRVEPQIRAETAVPPAKPSRHPNTNAFYDNTKRLQRAVTILNDGIDKPCNSLQKKRSLRSPLPLPPPPPPPPTTLNSHKSGVSHQATSNQQHYQIQPQIIHTPTEDDTMSNHSECTEITGVSDTVANSEIGESCNNTLSPKKDDSLERDSKYDNIKVKQLNSPLHLTKLTKDEGDYGAMFNTQINGLRNDYSLTKYMNRRKCQHPDDDPGSVITDTESQRESNNNSHYNNTNKLNELSDRLDVISISSRSNRSSSRLSDRTKELYRNAGVPVGIAYPQRSTAASSNSAAPTTSVQTVYRCEIEPVQLTHGMQIAMGLKDRAKKAKDLKNAWKKFVSLAASKFSPTQSPAPPFDKKTPSFLEVLDRDEGISSLIIDEHTQVTSSQGNYSAPANQNYYEQRFGTRPQELDSGYISADSGEVCKRSYYDRYNFKSMTGRDHVIRVDTIEDNSDGSGTPTGEGRLSRRSSILDSNRFEDFEHMGEPPPSELERIAVNDGSDAESVKTLTHDDSTSRQHRRTRTLESYSSEDERGHSPSYGSSETEGETNVEDMWESGAESIETHSVLYRNVKRS